MLVSMLGKGGFIKGKTLARGKQTDQFIVENSLWPAPGEVGSSPSPVYLVLDRGKGCLCARTPLLGLLPLKNQI